MRGRRASATGDARGVVGPLLRYHYDASSRDRIAARLRRMFGAPLAVTVLAAGAIASPTVFAQAAPPQRIDAVIVAVDGATLQLRPRGGGDPVAVALDGATRITARSASSMDRIVQGVFLGTTAAPSADGTLTATEVHIFAESMRGTGEGHRPMAGPPGSTMTNATVSNTKAAAQPGMTNATVAATSAAAQGLHMTLTYAGGEKVVAVPANTPVELIEPADRSALVPGASVAVRGARPDGPRRRARQRRQEWHAPAR
jgi:hypothetical protein